MILLLDFTFHAPQYMFFGVHTDPGISWNLEFKFFKPGKSLNQACVLESHGKSTQWLPHFWLGYLFLAVMYGIIVYWQTWFGLVIKCDQITITLNIW